MNYENRFTRANPGFIILLVDQSFSMSNEWTDGKSLAEQTALAINRCLAEMGAKFTSGTEIKKSAFIVIIGYGGIENSDSANLIRKGSIVEFMESPMRIESIKKKISDGAGGLIEIDYSMPINIEPTAVWGTPMASAFQLASSFIQEWKQRPLDSEDDLGNTVTRNELKDPVPLIVNISDGEPTDDPNDVRKYANEIMTTNFSDGTPLIFNIHLSPNGGLRVEFPKNENNIKDEMARLLYDISSKLPQSFVEDAKGSGFVVDGGERTFMSNVDTVEKFVGFLNFGTGTGVGNPK